MRFTLNADNNESLFFMSHLHDFKAHQVKPMPSYSYRPNSYEAESRQTPTILRSRTLMRSMTTILPVFISCRQNCPHSSAACTIGVARQSITAICINVSAASHLVSITAVFVDHHRLLQPAHIVTYYSAFSTARHAAEMRSHAERGLITGTAMSIVNSNTGFEPTAPAGDWCQQRLINAINCITRSSLLPRDSNIESGGSL